MWRILTIVALNIALSYGGCFDYDVDYTGHDLDEGHYVSTSTAQKCQLECQRNSGCNFWTWDRSYHNACWMKSSKTSTSHESGLVSGPKYCDNPPSPSRNPKRGVAFDPQKFKCDDFALFTNMGWFYNWGTHDPQHNSQCNGANIPDGYVPMIWGKTNNLPDYVKNYDTVLGFNEPNFDNQANMSPETAAHEWIKLQNYYKDQILVSPAAAPPHETDWFDRFFATCRELGCRIDYLATHLYTGNADYDKKHLKELYDRYGLKIWLTEFAKPSTFSVQDQMNYLSEMLPYLDSSDHIYRYSWFVHRFTHSGSGHGWYLDKAISLMKSDRSELTELGKFYNDF